MQFNHKFSRRRFGQLTITSSTLVGVGYFAQRTIAQTTDAKTPVIVETGALTSVLVGVIPGYLNNTNQSATVANNNSQSIKPTNSSFQMIDPTDSGNGLEVFMAATNAAPRLSTTPIVAPARELLVKSINLSTNLTSSNQTQATSSGIVLTGGTEAQLNRASRLNGDAITLQPYRQVSGLASLSNNKLVVATNATNVDQKGNPTRITVSQPSSIKTLDVIGLKTQDILGDLAGTNTSQVFGLVVERSSRSNARLVVVDINTGEIDFTERVRLPKNELFSTLTQCSNGRLYSTSIAQSGLISLVELDLNQKKSVPLAQLSLDGQPWRSGLKSLACSSANQIFAIASGRYEIETYLYLIDSKTGQMTKLQQFQTVRMTFLRS